MEELTQAQLDALELLHRIDAICEKNRISYSLCGKTLVWQQYGFELNTIGANEFSICVRYADYLQLLQYLQGQAPELVIVNHENHKDFDTLSAWVLKAEQELLPEERKEDECYYHTHIAIVPVFDAGGTKRDSKNARKEILRAFRMINARYPLTHKRLFSKIKGKYVRLRARIRRERCRRHHPSIQKLAAKLTEGPKEKGYLIFRDEHGNIPIIREEQFRMERVGFFGVETYAFADREAIIESQYQKLTKTPHPVSNLRLIGGRGLRRVQLIQLELLIEFDRICRKYDLKYNIAFGTLLGAVRHRGFIPWDDDADVNMPYEDYEKLKQIIDRELDAEKYYFRVQEKEQDCNITYAHLKRNGTVYTKPGRDGFTYHPGVYLDIVPIFNGAPNFLLHTIQTRICWFYRTACWAYMGAESETHFLKRQYYKLLAGMGNKKAYGKFIRYATFFKHTRNKMLFLNGRDRSPYNIGFVKRECFDVPVELEFEGHSFYAPSDYRQVLEYCYGKDYMRYLPVAKRAPKNKAMIELGNLYADIGGNKG